MTTVEEVARLARWRQEIAKASDTLAKGAEAVAGEMAAVKPLRIAQVRNLENIAYTTIKVSDVIDFLKTRIGRDEHGWGSGIGHTVLNQINQLRTQAEEIAGRLQVETARPEPDLVRQVHLELIREFAKHMAAHFEYQRKSRGEKE